VRGRPPTRPKRLGERVDADRGDHELLEVRRVAGVLAAIEDVERTGPGTVARSDAGEVAVERHAGMTRPDA